MSGTGYRPDVYVRTSDGKPSRRVQRCASLVVTYWPLFALNTTLSAGFELLGDLCEMAYHLISGLVQYLTRKEEFFVIIVGRLMPCLVSGAFRYSLACCFRMLFNFANRTR